MTFVTNRLSTVASEDDFLSRRRASVKCSFAMTAEQSLSQESHQRKAAKQASYSHVLICRSALSFP